MTILYGHAQPFIQSYLHEYGWNARDITELENKDILIGGSKSFVIGVSKMNVVRVDSLGNFIWNREYGFNFGNTLTSVGEDSEQNILLGGTTTGNQISVEFGKSILLKVDPQGDTIWQKVYQLGDSTKNNSIANIKILSDNSIVAVGNRRDYSNWMSQGNVFRVDTDGNLLWFDVQNDLGTDISYQEVILDAEENIYCLGKINIPDRSVDVIVAKYNKAGTKLWVKTFGVPLQDNPVSLLALDNGNILVNMSRQYDLNPSSSRCDIMEISSVTGDSLNSTPVPVYSDFEDCFSAVGHEMLSDNSMVIIKGTERIQGQNILHYEMMHFDRQGEEINHKWLPFTTADYTFWYTMAKTSDDHLLIAGNKRADTCATSSCLVLVKLTKEGDFVSSINIPNLSKDEFLLFPNPSNGIVNYKWQSGTGTEQIASYQVYSSTGQLIHFEKNPQRDSGVIDLANAPPGIYVIRFLFKSGREIAKRVVVQ